MVAYLCIQELKGTRVAADSGNSERQITHRGLDRYRQRTSGLAAADADAAAAGQEIEQVSWQLESVLADDDVADQLHVGVKEQVFVRRRTVRLVGGPPLQVASSYLPMHLVNDALRQEDSGPGGTYARIEDQGYTITRYDEHFVIRPASSDERHDLELDDDFPVVVEFERVAYADNNPVEYFTSVMAAARYAFKYTIPAT